MKNQNIILLFISILFLNITFGQDKETPKDWKINSNSNLKDYKEVICLLNGKLVSNEIIEKLGPNTIHKIDVLKEEEATALFGEKGRNGVILIQTKNISKKELKKLQKLYAYEHKESIDMKIMKVTGKIIDCEDKSLSNITISNLNTKEKTNSDLEGNYSINAHEGNVLLFSMEGFVSERILMDRQKTINIKLKLAPKKGQVMFKKPVIYLYPTQKTDVTFSFDFKGELLTTFPKYDQQWDITAYPDGKIFDKKTNRFYTSLFWDGQHNFPKEHYNYKEGFVVSKNNLNEFLIEKLEFIGLNHFETNDFVQYWLPILEKNELNFIHFRVNDEYDIISKNNVSPKPETSIRVFMDFYPLQEALTIPEQVLPKTERKGFTLVEWGGSDISDVVKKTNEF